MHKSPFQSHLFHQYLTPEIQRKPWIRGFNFFSFRICHVPCTMYVHSRTYSSILYAIGINYACTFCIIILVGTQSDCVMCVRAYKAQIRKTSIRRYHRLPHRNWKQWNIHYVLFQSHNNVIHMPYVLFAKKMVPYLQWISSKFSFEYVCVFCVCVYFGKGFDVISKANKSVLSTM